MLAAAAVGLLAILVPAGGVVAAPARTAPVDGGLYMEVRPGKVRAGERIQIVAQCAYTPNSTATSDAFGTVTLRAVEGADVATVTLRRDLRPGTYRVAIKCGDGRTGTVTFEVTGQAKPDTDPVDNVSVRPGKVRAGERIEIVAQCESDKSTATSDAFGTVALRPTEGGTGIARVTLRRNLRPGTYRVTIKCGDGRTATVTFEVTGAPKDGPPKGGPDTGAGGTDSAPGPAQIVAGLLAAGTVAAGLGAGLIRRRRRNAAAT
jgi:hypothetical protein